MSISPLTWSMYQQLFDISDIQPVYSEENALAHWLLVEQALAHCQAELQIIPAEAAQQIGAVTCEKFDKVALANAAEKTGRPIIGLVTEIQKQLADEHKDWVHYAVTTQDIMDTAAVLQMKEALQLIEQNLDNALITLRHKSQTYREFAMMGRTNGQHAQPISAGLKFALWHQELQRHLQRLQDIKRRALTVQLGGAVGTLASFQQQGLDLRALLAKKLGLYNSKLHWQNSRDSIAEVVQWAGLVAASLSKVAAECNRLCSSAIAEFYEDVSVDSGASSAMPHKQNQRHSEVTEALARLTSQRTSAALTFCQHEHERSGASWIIEWFIVPESLVLLFASSRKFNTLVQSIAVNHKQMQRNLFANPSATLSEPLIKYLTPFFGRAIAKKRLQALFIAMKQQDINLIEAIEQDTILRPPLSTVIQQLKALEDEPKNKTINAIGANEPTFVSSPAFDFFDLGMSIEQINHCFEPC